MKGIAQVMSTIKIATLTVENLIVNKDALANACTPELYATEEAYKLVKDEGMPFRDVYKKVAQKYK
jgi:argininosuccinate lyase